MAGDFGTQKGKFGSASSRDPKSSGKPSAGITNESHGTQNPKGPGQGVPPNSSRIR